MELVLLPIKFLYVTFDTISDKGYTLKYLEQFYSNAESTVTVVVIIPITLFPLHLSGLKIEVTFVCRFAVMMQMVTNLLCFLNDASDPGEGFHEESGPCT